MALDSGWCRFDLGPNRNKFWRIGWFLGGQTFEVNQIHFPKISKSNRINPRIKWLKTRNLVLLSNYNCHPYRIVISVLVSFFIWRAPFAETFPIK